MGYEIRHCAPKNKEVPSYWVVLREGSGFWVWRQVSIHFASRAEAERCVRVLEEDDRR